MSSNLSSIITLCAQRKKQQLFNVPPSRIEIVSPYVDNSNITKFKLDMRRKAEVLKYDKGNTKTNNLTKKQLFTQVMNGSSAPVSNSYIITNTVISTKASRVLACNNNDIPTTSSASGVPKDYINNVNTLYYDPTVPLYNYINPVLTRSYGIINSPFPTDVIQYSNYTNVNTLSSSLPITTVEFTEATTNNFYTLSLLTIPLAIQISGYINRTNTNTINIPISIPDISLNIYYNNSLLSPNSNYIYSIDPATNSSYKNNIYTLQILNSTISSQSFSQTVYIGNLNISNILLYSSPGYLYDFKLQFNTSGYSKSYSSGNAIVVSNISVSIIANVTNDYLTNAYLLNYYNMIFSTEEPNVSNLGVFTVAAI